NLPAQLFLLALLISGVQTLSYGLNLLPLVLLGWSFYLGWVPAVVLGFFFIRHQLTELDLPLILMGALTSVMLIGVPLEHLDVKCSEPWLGMVAYKGEWRRWYSSTEWVRMLSGFYRAPEVMAWHAATLTCLSIYLLVRRPTLAPLWLAQAAWG